jgi:hypothetical protein
MTENDPVKSQRNGGLSGLHPNLAGTVQYDAFILPSIGETRLGDSDHRVTFLQCIMYCAEF